MLVFIVFVVVALFLFQSVPLFVTKKTSGVLTGAVTGGVLTGAVTGGVLTGAVTGGVLTGAITSSMMTVSYTHLTLPTNRLV